MNKVRKQLLQAMPVCAVALCKALIVSAGSRRLVLLLGVLLLASGNGMAQTTVFTYQGKLNDNGNTASGQYDFQFKLFTTPTVGTGVQAGPTVSLANVTVTAGLFTVQLDFGASAFPGGDRFLEIAVKPTSGATFSVLGPRQAVTSTPYAIKSASATNADNATNATNATTAQNALQLGGVAASQYVQTTDARLTDARNPLPGSANYIQNTTAQQATSSFNISGNGTSGGTLSGNVVNATTQYNLNGSRILSKAGLDNLFAGVGAGSANTAGAANAFFGANAGAANTTGIVNAFFGRGAGAANTTGGFNAFFGDAGNSNTMGSSNAFFGSGAGATNTTGSSNAFFGSGAGSSNATGSFNTAIGTSANVGSGTLTNATAIGANARVDASNALVLGSINGINGATASTNVGIGTTAPANRLTVVQSTPGIFAGNFATSGLPTGQSFGLVVSAGTSNNDTAFQVRNQAAQLLFRIRGDGQVWIPLPIGAGAFQSCYSQTSGDNGESFMILRPCSSSLRYKTGINPFLGGLDIINRLRPISFTWKQDGTKDIGLGAEEVEKVAPLLTFRNDKGEIEGVKYNQLSAVFINAFKEQQGQIETQAKQIKEQQAQLKQQQQQLDALKKLLCQAKRASRRLPGQGVMR